MRWAKAYPTVLRENPKSHKKAHAAWKAVKKLPAGAAAAPVVAVVEKPANGGTITLEHVKKVAHVIQLLGGMHRVSEVLEVIKEMGGVKKFRDLAEAMSLVGTDDIPF